MHTIKQVRMMITSGNKLTVFKKKGCYYTLYMGSIFKQDNYPVLTTQLKLYCPSCTEELTNIVELEDTHIVYDVYCNVCRWSGDISPDIIS